MNEIMSESSQFNHKVRKTLLQIKQYLREIYNGIIQTAIKVWEKYQNETERFQRDF